MYFTIYFFQSLAFSIPFFAKHSYSSLLFYLSRNFSWCCCHIITTVFSKISNRNTRIPSQKSITLLYNSLSNALRSSSPLFFLVSLSWAWISIISMFQWENFTKTEHIHIFIQKRLHSTFVLQSNGKQCIYSLYIYNRLRGRKWENMYKNKNSYKNQIQNEIEWNRNVQRVRVCVIERQRAF